MFTSCSQGTGEVYVCVVKYILTGGLNVALLAVTGSHPLWPPSDTFGRISGALYDRSS